MGVDGRRDDAGHGRRDSRYKLERRRTLSARDGSEGCARRDQVLFSQVIAKLPDEEFANVLKVESIRGIRPMVRLFVRRSLESSDFERGYVDPCLFEGRYD